MNILIIQHEYYEKPFLIEKWAQKSNFKTQICNLFAYQNLPNIKDVDCIVIMGGSMNVYEESKYPWLKIEKIFIESAINNNKKIIGICLGAQLISTVLGYKVTQNNYKEIGFHKIYFEDQFIEKYKNFLTENIIKNKTLITLHWHGDTFQTPENAIKIAKSKGCENQGYILNDNILALQFHPEVTFDDLKFFLSIDPPKKRESEKDKYIQTKEEILKVDKEIYIQNKDFLYKLLENFLNTNNR